jgi:ABC-type transport system involved in multi-copper enzyme maturation permease subunit
MTQHQSDVEHPGPGKPQSRAIINFDNVIAVARLESRHTRRLLRYWVFLAIAYLVAIGMYVYYAVVHALYSSVSGSIGMIVSPRYLVAGVGFVYLIGFVLGIVFLGFDVRARDIRDGIVEVLDSRPLTNLELLCGRFIALFLSAWLPIVLLAFVMQGLGWLLPRLGSPIGGMVEPYSLFAFVVSMAIPGLAVAIALVFVVTLIVRNRLIAALICIATLLGAYAAVFALPTAQAQWIDFLGSTLLPVGSDIVPVLTAAGGWTQRVGMLALAVAFLALAVAVHPRLDGGRRIRPAATSAALILAGLLGIASSAHRFGAQAAQLEHWRAAHEARAAEVVAHIQSIAGFIDIAPGQRLDANLSLLISAPADHGLDRVLFTLNPGFSVLEVKAGGSRLKFTHVDGLLDIALGRSLSPGERLSLTLRYGGRPDVLFGYLDSAIQPEALTVSQKQIALLGQDRGIFDRRYVALTPGIRWLPASGADVGRGDPRKRGTDYFKLALEVEVPASWLVAGPGRRASVSITSERARFRFAPVPSVPEVGLMASQFRRVTTEIDGITFEVLLHPGHDRNLAVLADSRQEIQQWVAERLDVARRAGLAYPFDAFTLVEVPNSLRGYAGGWQLETALAPPAMMLLRETGFPTARFDVDVSAMFGKRDVRAEGGAARVNRTRLVRFFSNDVSGGNLFAGAARSFFADRTSAVGEGAIPLNFVLQELSTLLVSGRPSYFSAHAFRNLSQFTTKATVGMIAGQELADVVLNARTQRPAVWDAALDVSLARMDPWKNPSRTVDLLTLKGGRMAQAIYDALGPQAVGALLADLLDKHAGTTFTLADFIAAGRRVNGDLAGLFEDWVGGTGLPGFVTESAEVYRLPDEPGKASRYEMLLRLSNPERVTGFARVEWAMKADGPRTNSSPIRIPGHSTVEFGAVLSAPPAMAFVHPYLSLNREDFVAAGFSPSDIPLRDTAPLDGPREVPFGSGRIDDRRIVADDLDAGFRIVGGEKEGSVAPHDGTGTPASVDLDQGLPVADGLNLMPRTWSRRSNVSAWGRYRHTFAHIASGDGTRRAVMPALLPAAGVWALEIYLPYLPYLPANARGTWHLEVVSESGRQTVSYDAKAANVGWNRVGEYPLPAGEVRVELSSQTDGRMVVADAISWSPVRVQRAVSEASAR